MNTYRTKDLTEASVQIIKGSKLLRSEWEGKSCYFVFEDKEKCDVIANDYWFGVCEVGARELSSTMIRLKNRIFNDQGMNLS